MFLNITSITFFFLSKRSLVVKKESSNKINEDSSHVLLPYPNNNLF
uniref:Uncharacterized protein n=1 Tax=Arundo donax TaxID=35708 RepID=A0A0A9GTW5_ARUDO